jgi:hypothetical protein
MKPDLIYFLVDPSDFPDKQAVLDLVHKHDADGKIKMNIVAFPHNLDDPNPPPPDPEVTTFLSKLAKETGGKYEYIDKARAQQLQ